MIRPAAVHLARTIPWPPLLAGCGTGAVIMVIVRFSGALQQPPAVVGAIRLGFVPVITGLSFLLREPGRNLAVTFPAPGWLTTAAHLALAVPVLAAASWIQFTLAADALPDPAGPAVPLPWVALPAELAAWCAVTIAAAALVARSRWDHLGGAVAAPATFALLAILGFGRWHLLPAFPAPTRTAHASWEYAHWAWALLALAACGVSCWASRDRWSRLRRPRRAAPGGPAGPRITHGGRTRHRLFTGRGGQGRGWAPRCRRRPR